MMMSGSKSAISCTCRSVMPPETGMTVQPEPLGAVVRAEAAGEQAVAVGDVQLHAGPAAGGADRARHHLGPGVDVALGVADDGRLAGGAGGGVDAHDLLARHGEHAEGIVVAQVLLGGEGELGEVGQRVEVVGMHAGGVERLPVVGHVVVDVPQRPLQPLELQGGDLVARGDLDRVEVLAAWVSGRACGRRASSVRGTSVPGIDAADGRGTRRSPRRASFVTVTS